MGLELADEAMQLLRNIANSTASTDSKLDALKSQVQKHEQDDKDRFERIDDHIKSLRKTDIELSKLDQQARLETAEKRAQVAELALLNQKDRQSQVVVRVIAGILIAIGSALTGFFAQGCSL